MYRSQGLICIYHLSGSSWLDHRTLLMGDRDGTLTLAPATFLLAPLQTVPPTEVDGTAASCSPAFNNLGNGPWFLGALSPTHINCPFPITINKGAKESRRKKFHSPLRF